MVKPGISVNAVMIRGVDHVVIRRIGALDDNFWQVAGKDVREPVRKILPRRVLFKCGIRDEGDYVQVINCLDVVGADVSHLAILAVEVVVGIVVGKRELDRLQLHVLCFFQGYPVQVTWFENGLIGWIPRVSWRDAGLTARRAALRAS